LNAHGIEATKPWSMLQGFVVCSVIVSRKFLRFAEIIRADRASTAVFAEILCRADQPDKFLGVGFYKPLFLEGT
jgi:hypothetical protein